MTNEKAQELLRRKADKMLQLADSLSPSNSMIVISKQERGLIRIAALEAMQEFCVDLQTQYLNGVEPDDMGHSLDSFMNEYWI